MPRRSTLLRQLYTVALRLLILASAVAACGGGSDGPTPPRTGALAITTTTTGTSLDTDGYQVAVQGGPTLAVPSNGTIHVPSLAPGAHDVTVTGVASTCTLAGGATRSAVVVAGDTLAVSLSVTCAAPEPDPAIRVVVRTLGAELDPDGYFASVPGSTPQRVAANGEVLLGGFATDTETTPVTLSDVAPNCAVAGAATAAVMTPAGGKAGTTFDVVCGPSVPGNTILVEAFTTGDFPNPEGYEVRLSTLDVRTLPNNGSVSFTGVPAGTHEPRLERVALQCQYAAPTAVQVSATQGARMPVISRCASVAPVCREATLDLQVTAGLAPTIRWASECAVQSLWIIDRTTGRMAWMVGGSALQSPVTYGAVPAGAERYSSALALRPGAEYHLSVIFVEASTYRTISATSLFTR